MLCSESAENRPCSGLCTVDRDRPLPWWVQVAKGICWSIRPHLLLALEWYTRAENRCRHWLGAYYRSRLWLWWIKVLHGMLRQGWELVLSTGNGNANRAKNQHTHRR